MNANPDREEFVEVLDVLGEQTVEVTLSDEEMKKLLGNFR